MLISSWKSRVFIYGGLLIGIVAFFIMTFGNLGMSEKFLRDSCKIRLREISMAIMQYKLDHFDYPPNLSYLVSANYLDSNKLSCPLARVHGGVAINGLRYFAHLEKGAQGNDYIYLRPASEGLPESNIICLDKLQNHEGKTNDVNAIHIDGAVDTIPVKSLSPWLIGQIQNKTTKPSPAQPDKP